MTDNIPGHLQPIYRVAEWKDLLFKSSISAEHKLVGAVIAETCAYSRLHQLNLSAISFYSISRFLNLTQDSVKQLVGDLIRLGWIYDTKKPVGARQVYALTFSLIPQGDLRQ